ncbi:MAG: Histidyl-tRNA synthetase [Micavibrio sp.]|nr:Histidyl-tRNA synthetase [Micavibrio sp.]
MSNDRKIYKPGPIRGFPEWLPEERLVEQKWFDHIRNVFESYGFCSIETPSVEEIDVLTAKGEVDKEIYVIERLHKDDSDKSEARLALHFDQTVPFARYVAMRFNDLVFPFKRYQIQRVWRGERPQAGRFREFYQCDIDVIGVDALPMHFDAEMPAVMWEILTGLPGMENEKIQMQISNRKVLLGLLAHLGIKDAVKYTTFIDKMEKIGIDAVKAGLKLNLRLDELSEDIADKILHLASIKTSDAVTLRAEIAKLGINDESFNIGVEELAFVLESLKGLPKDAIVADLSIVRGLDYYTGTVYETRFLDDPTYGSICSGGRYDDLASGYINKHLPGVGISIGFSRLFAKMIEKGTLNTTQKSPADLMMIMPSEDRRGEILALCQGLRKRGIKVEMYHAARKIPDQLKYAAKKGIPYVWFPDEDGHKIKNMLTQEQGPADPATWERPQ